MSKQILLHETWRPDGGRSINSWKSNQQTDVSLIKPPAIVWEYKRVAVVAKIRAYKANVPCTQRVGQTMFSKSSVLSTMVAPDDRYIQVKPCVELCVP